jgi:O-acetyl-ADP-ribose deacetylase (regulator of RNase III)
MTRVRPCATYTIQGARVELFILPHTSLHRVAADALILACDATLRMTKGFCKQLRDYAGFDLVEQEAVSCAPLPPQGVAITGAGRTKFRHILHANIYDAQYTTDAERQLQGLLNALAVAAERGMQTVAFADYTLDLRRAVAEETAWTIAQAIAQRPSRLNQFKILCTNAVNSWAFQQILSWVSQKGFEPYRGMYRVRHTVLHAFHGDWQKTPAHGFWRFTEPSLRPDDAFIKRGGQILRAKTQELAPIALGDSTITAGGALHYPFVIHLAAVESGRIPSRDTLVAAVRAALSLSHNQNLSTLLIPMPSSLNGMAQSEFAHAVVATISDYLHELISRIERCILLGVNDAEFRAWQEAVDALREQLSLPPLETAYSQGA